MNFNYSSIFVGVAVFNGEKTLDRTLSSLKNQTFEDITVLICDDNSTDRSLDIIKKYLSECPNFFLLQNEKNLGMFKNYNKLFQISNSKYFAWVDQDDFRDKKFFEKCFYELEQDQEGVLAFAKTGVKDKFSDKLMHINTINSLINLNDVVLRYKKLIENFHDTIVYALIRSNTLKDTNMWTNFNGSANRLIFELCLNGKFLQINETLTFYYGMGLTKRFTSDEEYERSTKSKKKFYYIPFIFLFFNQCIDVIKHRKIKIFQKIKILFYLLKHLFLVNFFKCVYRSLDIFKFKSINNLIFDIMPNYLKKNDDIEKIVDPEKYPSFYPKHYPFKKIKKNLND